MEEEEDNKTRKGRKSKLLAKLLSNKLAIIVIAILLIGILLGMYIQHNYVEEYLDSKDSSDYNVLIGEKDKRINDLDIVADAYYKCLIDSGISPKTC